MFTTGPARHFEPARSYPSCGRLAGSSTPPGRDAPTASTPLIPPGADVKIPTPEACPPDARLTTTKRVAKLLLARGANPKVGLVGTLGPRHSLSIEKENGGGQRRNGGSAGAPSRVYRDGDHSTRCLIQLAR